MKVNLFSKTLFNVTTAALPHWKIPNVWHDLMYTLHSKCLLPIRKVDSPLFPLQLLIELAFKRSTKEQLLVLTCTVKLKHPLTITKTSLWIEAYFLKILLTTQGYTFLLYCITSIWKNLTAKLVYREYDCTVSVCLFF